MDRRGFLKTTGVAGILAAGRAPAFAQGTKLHLLRWVDFVPAEDARRVPAARDATQEEGPPDRPDAGSHLRRRAGLELSDALELRRRRARPPGQDQARQQGNGRVGQVDDGVLEGRLRRGGLRL